MPPEHRLDRRSLLLAGAGLLLTGSACSSGHEAPDADAGTTDRPPQTPPDSAAVTTLPDTTPPKVTPPADRLPWVDPWSPNPGDLHPELKLLAAQVIAAIGTWSTGQGGPIRGARRVEALGQSGRLGSASYRPLNAGSEAAALEVVEAQYGGLLATTASVLVVCRQWHADPEGHVTAGGTTVDVRLAKHRRRWRVTAVHPGVLPPPERPISRLARAVLAERRIELPPAAEADVAAGDVHDSVLTAMLRLAQTFRVGVSVIRSGHPTHVFGTDRVSDHEQGRAFDTWQIDGRPVVDPSTPRSLVTRYLTAAAAAGAYNIGGPYLPARGAATFFSDATHHDHVHVAFAS